MKILCDCGLVNGRKEGKWMYYSLNGEKVKGFKDFLCDITINKEDCICNGLQRAVSILALRAPRGLGA